MKSKKKGRPVAKKTKSETDQILNARLVRAIRGRRERQVVSGKKLMVIRLVEMGLAAWPP